MINDNLKSTEKSKIKKKKKTIPDNVSREKSKNKSKSRSTKKVSNSKDEAKNREVRKLLEYTGLSVNRLIRTSYGDFKLGELPVGKTIPVPHKTLYDLILSKK